MSKKAAPLAMSNMIKIFQNVTDKTRLMTPRCKININKKQVTWTLAFKTNYVQSQLYRIINYSYKNSHEILLNKNLTTDS